MFHSNYVQGAGVYMLRHGPCTRKHTQIKSERVSRLEFKQYYDDDASFVRENI